MHTRDIILIQTTATIAAILIMYGVLVNLPEKKRHTPPRYQGPRALNFTELVSCETVPAILIHIFTSNIHNLKRLVTSLNAADYGPAVSNLTIFGDSSVVHRLESWKHGGYKFITPPRPQAYRLQDSNKQMVIVLDDCMEVSPMYALWFLIQGCAQPNATAIAGGGKSADSVAGLAMTADVWKGFTRNWTAVNNTTPTKSVLSYLSRLSNSTIIMPLLPSKDHVFVRPEWQNPVYVEHAPKLMRSWDPEREPVWRAVEIRLGWEDKHHSIF
jgi:hypothetical protein